jgi:iron-sulfur cluster insertion protein
MDFEIIITLSAIKRIKYLLAKQKSGAQASSDKLRISVEGGGCSGMQYKYEFVDSVFDDDALVSQDGIICLIDGQSQEFLNGSVVDYVENLGSAYFEIRNPKASAKCGCGNSFSI